MRREYIKRMLASILLLCCLSMSTVYADVTQEDIDNARDQIENIQEQVNDAEKEIDKINDKKDALEGDLKTLNKNLSTLAEEMNELEAQIADKQHEIAVTTDELHAAEDQCEKQYEDMKTRIQFMYENGDVSMLSMILSSNSIADFLNRTEYVSSINSYDRAKLDEYQQLQADIETKKAILEDEEEVLLALQEKMEQKKKEVNSLIVATKDNISKTKTEIANAESEKKKLEEQLEYWEDYEKELEAQKAREDLARWEEIQNMDRGDWAGVPYAPAEGEAYLLAAIIQCESEGEPYEGKLAVGSVVLNRVRSSSFPNTITGVVYQKKQFSPVASGRLAYRLEAGVNDECKRAALEVLNGNITLNCLFFRRNNGIIQGIVIGNHVFY